MCMNCGCDPCSNSCVTLTLTEQQQQKIDDLCPLLEQQGFHMYLVVDPTGVRHLCITNALDENKNIDLDMGDFPHRI